MSEISQLSAFCTELNWENIPAEVREAAAFHVLDSIGVALGAADNEQNRRVSALWLKNETTQEASVWQQKCQAGLGKATFLNAMLGHTLEMDDVHTESKTHIGTVVVPAAWAMAEYLKASGKELLLAVICGYEVMSRIGMAFGVSAHRNKGWHVTATAGTFGAAAACAKLLKLSTEETINALGLAGAQSFGNWAFLGDGATCKVLNPARAAQVGLESALLAKAGMTGPEHILTAEDGGLFTMMSEGADVTLVAKELGKTWQSLRVDNKPYPACRSTHCVIDGMLELCEKYNLQSEDIEHVTVETYLVGYKQCGLAPGSIDPQNAVNAKFSTAFVAACAVLFGKFGLQQVEQDVIDNPEVKALLKKVEVRPAEDLTKLYPEHWGCRIAVEGKNGATYKIYVKDASGSVAKPLTAEQVKAKAVGLMEKVGIADGEKLAEAILNLEKTATLPSL